MGTSVLLSQKYRSTHTRFLHGNFCTSVAEVHKYTSSLSYLLPLDRSTDVLNIHTRYMHGNFSTSVSSRDSSTEVLNIHTRNLHGNFSTSVAEVQKYTHNVPTWELQYFCHRSTHTMFLHGNFSTSVKEVQKYTHKVRTWELLYFCSRSTEVHKWLLSQKYWISIQGTCMGTSVLLSQKYRRTHTRFLPDFTEVPSWRTEVPSKLTEVPLLRAEVHKCRGDGNFCTSVAVKILNQDNNWFHRSTLVKNRSSL